MRNNACVETSLWSTIDEKYWTHFFYKDISMNKSEIIRVRPGMPEYNEVVMIRYNGFIRSGYIKKETDISSMVLERDKDSIILAVRDNGVITATLTLNTPTEKFPAPALVLEKGIVFNDSRIQRPDIIEFVKAATDLKISSVRKGVNLFLTACIIARLTHKYHFMHVSRVVPEAMKFMRKFGFVYAPELSFTDKLLNNTPSCIGYCEYSSIVSNPEVPYGVKDFINILNAHNVKYNGDRVLWEMKA
jgi:hypothetical protein